MEIDEFQFNFSATEKPHVQNDTVVLSRKFLHDAEMKLAISYALAQSTKLSVRERAGAWGCACVTGGWGARSGGEAGD
eukprot:315937-Chlamydomonas_euryale.AAC.1